MKIVIIGAGFTGIQLAKRLVDGKNNVIIIDNDDNVVANADRQLDCGTICADGKNIKSLEEVGIANADALVCLTDNDELNMLICSLVDSIYPNVKKIARIRDYSYYTNILETKKKYFEENISGKPYGIDFVVNPDFESAMAIVNSIEKNSVLESFKLENSSFELLRIRVEKDSFFDGMKVMNLPTLIKKIFETELKNPDYTEKSEYERKEEIKIENLRKIFIKEKKLSKPNFLIAYIERENVTSIASGRSEIKANDTIGIFVERKNIELFLTLCGSEIKNIQKIVLFGAGRIGMIVAEKLGEKKLWSSNFFSRTENLLIVESDKERADLAEEKLSKIATIINDDIMSESFNNDENIGKYDLIVCSTNNYEKNIVTAAYIQSLGVENSIVLVPSMAFNSIAHRLGIEVAIPLNDTVVDSIMCHLQGSVSDLHTINGGVLEITEFTLSKKANLNRKKIMESKVSEEGVFLFLMGKKKGESEFSTLGGLSVLEDEEKIVLISKKEASQRLLERFS